LLFDKLSTALYEGSSAVFTPSSDDYIIGRLILAGSILLKTVTPSEAQLLRKEECNIRRIIETMRVNLGKWLFSGAIEQLRACMRMNIKGIHGLKCYVLKHVSQAFLKLPVSISEVS
jgi:hypothetical protein